MNWKAFLKCKVNTQEAIEKAMNEEIRINQIKEATYIVLYKKRNLTKQDILQCINEKYENIILDDTDISSLISIYEVIRNEDMYGENNIREFIDDKENNIVKLVDRMNIFAKKQAKRQKNAVNISEFVPTDFEIIKSLKDEIDDEKTKA